ncbi:peptidyl-tRNA hydrolase 2, mitochondrial [Trichonephila clavata]|uniref:peptidyl-tRNA hydrolase n=1 Tax=Trichonephila clavata TaxID=2740835 RepID=A0A8X6M1B0_TRICU|nr:peptidyl-tRNA hydrolase 2, mitochondrial [Trichonephila clavata]
MLEGNVLYSVVTNACVLGCGVILGYVVKSWLKSDAAMESIEDSTKESFEEEMFSDYVQGDQKLVLVVQNGLKMGKGKIAAQVL